MNLEIYDYKGNLLDKNIRILSDNFSFQNILGSGQTSMSLKLKYKKMDLLGKFIKFYCDEKLVFSGQITTESFDLIGTTTITIYGFFNLFGSFSVKRDFDTYGSVVNYLINKISSNFPFFQPKKFFDATTSLKSNECKYSNPTIGSTVFSQIKEISDYDFFISAEGGVYFSKNISEKEHTISIGINGEIISGNAGRTLNGYVSKVEASYTSNNKTYNTGKIKNEEDIKKFGVYSRILNVGEATAYDAIQKVKDTLNSPEFTVQIEVRGDIWKYQVGDYVTITNCDIKLEKVKIIRIEFSRYKAKLYLDNYSDFFTNTKDFIGEKLRSFGLSL